MWKLEWTRRDFLKKTGAWAGAGLLQPVLQLMGDGKSLAAAYPEEVLSIEKYTKGKVKPGMIISKHNADLVKDISPEGLYIELKRGTTQIKIAETNLDPEASQPYQWIEATVRNKGQAILDKKGQLWHKDGKPWIGGTPFPEPKTALEVLWNFRFNPRRYDDLTQASRMVTIDNQGRTVGEQVAIYKHIQVVGRIVVDPRPIIPQFKDELDRTLLSLTQPYDLYGLAVAATVYYDATKIPDTDIYIPALRRTRRVPSSQRFDTAAPYTVIFTSDLDFQNDPVLTWEWKLVGRKPMLGPSSVNLGARVKGTTKEDFIFPDVAVKLPNTTWELRPEMILVEGVTNLEGNPYSRKRLYIDGINNACFQGDFYDLAGKIWKFLFLSMGDTGIKDSKGRAVIDTTMMTFADLQRDYHTNVHFYNEYKGLKFAVNNGDKIEDWMTPAAMLKRGRR